MIKVLIEELNVNDANKIVEWKNDKSLSDLILSDYSIITLEEAEGWIVRNVNDTKQRLFGIYVQKDGMKREIVGVSRIMFIDFHSGVAELGLYIGNKRNRGKGIGKQSLLDTIDYAFNELSLNKVFLKVKEDNIAAIQLYTKCNFVIEGKLKEHFIIDDSFSNNNLLIMSKFNNK